jgi:Mn-dependent DtxR family transcriptional regulator
MSRSEFEATERPATCETCETRRPSSRTTLWGWVCYTCKQRWEAGKDAFACADEDARRAALPVAPPVTIQSPAPVLRARPAEIPCATAPAPTVATDAGASIPLSNNITPETEWVPAAKSLPTDSPPDASPVEPPPPAMSAPSPTIARPAEPVSRKAVPATRTAAVGGEADALIQDKVQDAMMDEPNLPSVVLAARLGISAGGVRACVCRLRKRGVLPPPARQYAPSSRPRAGAQKEAIRAAVLADPDISSAALAARLGTTPDTVRSCISLLRRSGALPPAPRRRTEPAPPAEPQPREPQLQERIQAAMLAEPRVTSTTLAARLNTSPASVRSAVGTLRQRGLLPPAPERPLVEPDTMRGRLLQLITEQPGIGGIRAAQILGTTESCMHDTFSALRKRRLIAPADPARPGGYPLASTPPQEPPMAAAQPDPAARIDATITAIALALGIEDAEDATAEEILQAARAQTEGVEWLRGEKRALQEALTGARAEADRLATATPNLTAADLERRIELWGSAYRLEEQATTLRQQAQGTLACGVVLSADELRHVAEMRDDAARALRTKALTGAA